MPAAGARPKPKRILRDARSASDAVFAELERMRKEQAKADRAINANEARAERAAS